MTTTGYLVFPDLKSAQDRSHTEALARGCKDRDVTQWWWEAREDPTTKGQFLILLDDVRVAYAKTALTTVEKTKVLSDPTVISLLNSPPSPIVVGGKINGN